MVNSTLREKILLLFRQQTDSGFVSGEELSTALGVSRTAIWKQISLLRKQGYVVEAVPSRGYRMVAAPDRLGVDELRSGLGTRTIGCRIVVLDQVDSTNLQAYRAGDGGEPEGTVILAEEQTAGKGRMGRRWHSPPGVNLYLSILLRPPLPPRVAPQLTFLSAAAVARAIAATTGLTPTVKWPNDILVGGRKVAGLLNEMNAETEELHFVILGIGINVNMTAGQFPADLRYPATSLAIELGAPVSRSALARHLLQQLDELYARYLSDGFTAVRPVWEGYFDQVGRRVEVDQQSRVLTGRVEGIDEDGALLLRLDDGELERILAGDIRPL